MKPIPTFFCSIFYNKKVPNLDLKVHLTEPSFKENVDEHSIRATEASFQHSMEVISLKCMLVNPEKSPTIIKSEHNPKTTYNYKHIHIFPH